MISCLFVHNNIVYGPRVEYTSIENKGFSRGAFDESVPEIEAMAQKEMDKIK